MRRATVAIALCLELAGMKAAAAQWSMLGDERILVGKLIVDVGVLRLQEKREIPPLELNRKPPDPLPLGRAVRFLEFRGQRTICFVDNFRASYGGRAAILLADKDGLLQMATIDTPAVGVEVVVRTPTRTECP